MSGFDFTDKVMLVTGGAGGIGSALCRRFASGGARCVVVDIDGIRAMKVAADLPGVGHTGIGCDLMDRAQVERLFEVVADDHGRLDVLVNNVGMTSAERFDVRSVESIEREITLNLTSPLVATRIALPLLMASPDARVVTTVSLGGIFPLGETPIYTASKFGLRGAMLAIGLDLRSKGILAGSVLPSATDTRMLRQEAVDGGNSMQFQDRPQQPADVVAAVVSLLDSEDAGKPITECRSGDVPGAIESIRWFAEAADKVFGRIAPSGPDGLGLMSREPVGVVAAILPWNYPLAMTAWKVGPALAAGNCLLVKPAEATPRSALHLAALAAAAGLPDGVLTVLPGYGEEAGAALARSPLVGALSFTGSTGTGRRILQDAAQSNFKRVSLEMGGKSPQVLMADALSYGDELIDNMIEAAFLTMGQNCTAGSRVLVHRSIAEEVLARFTAAASELVIGDPADPRTQMGPLIDHAALDRVAGAVEAARAGGARIHTGGLPHGLPPRGAYYPPTVITRAPDDSDVLTRELFGPVVTVQTFTSEDEAVRRANATEYGLAASVWTRDLDAALRLARRIEAGVVSGPRSPLNGPWRPEPAFRVRLRFPEPARHPTGEGAVDRSPP